jgi:hypothetical protein
MPSFLMTGNSFFPPQTIPPIQYTPSSGNVVVIPSGATRAYITPSATLAALTIKLPPGPTPGQEVSIVSTQTVTALTMQTAAGGAVAGSPTALVINTEVLMRYAGGAWIWIK